MTPFETVRNTLIVVLTLAMVVLVINTIGVWIGLMVAILLASALRPAVMRLKKFGVPHSLAILMVFGTLFVGVILLLVAILPPIINEFAGYIQNENLLAGRIILARNTIERTLSSLTGNDISFGIPNEEIHAAVENLVNRIRITAPTLLDDIGSFIGEFILMIVMGIYWFSARDTSEQFLINLVPISRRGQVRMILDEIEITLGAYVRGLALVSLIVGGLCFAALLILRVPNAAAISLLYGLSTAIPTIGGLIGVILGTAVALISSPLNALAVFIVTVFLQQVENYIISPRVMSRSTEFDPLLIIIFVGVGFSLYGVLGALLSIPLAGAVSIVFKHMVLEPRRAKVVPTRVDGGVLLVTEQKLPGPSPDQPS